MQMYSGVEVWLQAFLTSVLDGNMDTLPFVKLRETSSLFQREEQRLRVFEHSDSENTKP